MRALPGEQLAGAVAVDDGQHRAVAAPPARTAARAGVTRAVIWMRLGVPTASAGLDGGARIVGVDVHRVVARRVRRRRDGHRFAQLRPARARNVSHRAASQPLEQVHHLELRRAPVRRRSSACGRGAGRYSCRCGACPVSAAAHRVQQDQQAAPAGVDHAGLGQHVELPRWCLLERDGCGVGGGRDHRRRGRPPSAALARRRRPRPAAPTRWCRARPRPSTRRPGRRRGRSAAREHRGRRCRPAGAVALGAAAAVTSARPRRICDRITPELPAAPRAAPPAASAGGLRRRRSSGRSASACAHADRMVNSMLVPVSASATGKTLSRLISSVWVIRWPTAVCAQARRAEASSRTSRHRTSPPSMPPPCAQPGHRWLTGTWHGRSRRWTGFLVIRSPRPVSWSGCRVTRTVGC